ncbi:secreted RxLR effector protein 161-like [Alnus glutinosa]|uniref:secreted RxLR effector protein 161-like n=1 Tax=Alnus glutinosa TaxID=3517 RepID=UPI002D796539|nr:secreted RxLR effector protein 161-like [Alnus glutinosa]
MACKLKRSIYGLKQASSGSRYNFLVLYVDDILLAANDNGLMFETKDMLSFHFDMKDLGEASYSCFPGKAPIVKGDVFLKSQCPYNDNERTQMQAVPYASVEGVLGRYLSDLGLSHWTAAKKVLRYLKGTKDFILTYRRSNILDVVGYSDADFASCSDDRRSTSRYIFMMAEGAVSWKSVKQTLTTSSTMEAEYIAYYQATCQAIWL